MPTKPIAHAPKEQEIAGSQTDVPAELVRAELNHILASKYFQSCRRGKEFLRFIVGQALDGQGDQLKERVIGIQVFGRRPDYSTGEDPIVRVQAGDVRRRLENYNADPDRESGVTIQLPLGSYAPVISRRSATMETSQNGPVSVTRPSTVKGPELSAASVVAAVPFAFEAAPATAPVPYRPSSRPARFWWTAAVAIALAAVGLLLFGLTRRSTQELTRDFWAPVLNSPQPVLLWMPKPMLYRPSGNLFERYNKMHSNAFGSSAERRNELLPMQPGDAIFWRDVVPVTNAGPAVGGVVAAMRVGRILTEHRKRYELRFGQEASYAALRDSPAVIVGGQNTAWSPQLVSGLHFAFEDVHGEGAIRENVGSRRVWLMESGADGRLTRDFGLITRELSSRSGQFLVQVAGISDVGTEAAGDFLDNQVLLAKVLRDAKVNLKRQNLQILISTDITDGKAGPPHVIAVSSW